MSSVVRGRRRWCVGWSLIAALAVLAGCGTTPKKKAPVVVDECDPTDPECENYVPPEDATGADATGADVADAGAANDTGAPANDVAGNEVDGADVDAHLQGAGADDRAELAALEGVLVLEAGLAAHGAMVGAHPALAQLLLQLERQALHHPPGVDEDEGGPVLEDDAGDLVEDLVHLAMAGHGLELVVGGDARERGRGHHRGAHLRRGIRGRGVHHGAQASIAAHHGNATGR